MEKIRCSSCGVVVRIKKALMTKLNDEEIINFNCRFCEQIYLAID